MLDTFARIAQYDSFAQYFSSLRPVDLTNSASLLSQFMVDSIEVGSPVGAIVGAMVGASVGAMVGARVGCALLHSPHILGQIWV